MGKIVGLLGSGIGLIVEASGGPSRNPRRDRRASKSTCAPLNNYRTPSLSQGTSAPPRGRLSFQSTIYSIDESKSIRLENETPTSYCRSGQRQESNDRCDIETARQSFHDCGTQRYPPEKCDIYDRDRLQEQDLQAYCAGAPPSYEDSARSLRSNHPAMPPKNDQLRPSSTRIAIDDVERYDDAMPRSGMSPGPLLLPVIIPQRRPSDKGRGWLMCYAPMLEDCDIDEDEFLQFLSDFNESGKASPWLDAVNVAGAGVGFAPGITPMIVSMVVPVAVKAAKTTQTNSRVKTFLDYANEQFFALHGLRAVIMTYKPQNPNSQTVSVNTATSWNVVDSLSPGSCALNGQPQQLVDVTPGDVGLPESAPLVYPDADATIGIHDTRFGRAGHFVADYMDRRGQAKYEQNNPNSSLSQGQPVQFSSAWSDPRSPMYSGGLKALVSGGRLGGVNGQDPKKQQRRQGRTEKKERRKNRGLIRGARTRYMRSDVLYLMIVNSPTPMEET